MAATSKEVVRSVLTKLGLLRIVQEVLGKKKTYLAHANVADRFSQIYRDGVWQHGQKSTPLSGEGSSLSATVELRRQLPRQLERLGVTRLLDLGCGDFTWMSQVDLGGVEYTGADIVPSVIASNQRVYGNERRTFIVANCISDVLPEADAILCREVLFHLSFADAKSLLKKALSTGAGHFFLTTDTATLINSDIRTGDFRVLNLMAAPFRLPEPVWFVAEDKSRPGRRLAQWKASDIANALA